MESNGSPLPIFETDANHSYFLAIFPIHPEASRRSARIDEKTPPTSDKTHQFEPKTHQLDEELSFESLPELPEGLKIKLDGLSRRPKYETLRSIICELCAWQPLTAQQLSGVLRKKDKKYLVRQYLTPLVKEGVLKYIYPERGNTPLQAYRA